MRASFAFVVLATLPLSHAAFAAQKWGPTWSEVTGARHSPTKMHREGAVISRIDGKSYTDRVVKVEPGLREIVVRSPMRKGFAGSDETMRLELKPCYRYYINAQFKSSVGTEWEPVLVSQERIAGCKVPPA